MPSLVGAPSRPAAPRRAVPAAAWTALGKQHANRLFIFGLGYTGLGEHRQRLLAGQLGGSACTRNVDAQRASCPALIALPPRCRCCRAGAATYFQQRGWEVAGTCRTQEKCERLARHDIHTHYFDPTEFNNLRCAGDAGGESRGASLAARV